MILHFSQIGFTDDLTFTVILLSIDHKVAKALYQSFFGNASIFRPNFYLSQYLFVSPDDSALGQIVWGHLQGYFIARKNTDIIHAELSADVCQNLMAVFQLYLEHGVWKLLNYGSFNFDYVCF